MCMAILWETDMFSIGDTVIHPNHGIRKVESIQNDISTEAKRLIYVLKPNKPIPGNFRLLIPKETIKSSGVHYPINKSKIPSVLQVLEDEPNGLSEDYTRGYDLSKEKIQSGNLYKTAEALRDLEKQKDHKSYSIKEQLLQSARKILVEEISYVKGIHKYEAEELVDNALQKKERRGKQ